MEYGNGCALLSLPCGFTKRVRSIFNRFASAFIWPTKTATGALPGTRHDGLQRLAHVIGQRVGRDVVRLHQGRVEQVAQRARVARLKPDKVFGNAGKGFRRDGCDLVQVTGVMLGPIENHHRHRHFGQAANLTFLPRFFFLKNEAGLGINNDEGLRRTHSARGEDAEKERKKCGEKTGSSSHDLGNGCTLVGAI